MYEHAEAGDLIGGRFRLESLLGTGGMGAVWKAQQLSLDRPVAVKLLHAEYAAREEARLRFEREARVASSLVHDHVIRILDFGESEGQLYIAMEYLEGGTLRDIVDEHLAVPPVRQTLDILTQVSAATLAAHEVGLVHRDLKPENIFLEATESGASRAVVVDFGLAFIADRDQKSGRLTQEGVAVGTPDYMPPEQVQGNRDIGPPADVYALGCVLYEMLSGQVPFTGEAMQILTAHLFSAPRLPSEVRRDLSISRELEGLCMKMLAKDGAVRPTMEIVHAILSRHEAGPQGRDRGRAEGPLTGRAARMVSFVGDSTATGRGKTMADLGALAVDAAEVAVLGALDGDVLIGLGANSLVPFIIEQPEEASGAEALYAPGRSPASIGELVALGMPVVTDADPTDLDRMTALLRAGVTEVVHQPVRAAELSRRLWRAIRRSRRRTDRGEGA